MNEPHAEGDRGRVAAAPARGPGFKLAAALAMLAVAVSAIVYLGFSVLRVPKSATTAQAAPKRAQQVVGNAVDVPVRALEPKVELRPSPDLPKLGSMVVVEGDKMLEAARRAPVTAYSRTMSGPAGSSGDGYASPAGAEDSGAFEKRFKSPIFEGSKAGHMGDRRFIVAQGTQIPCILETAMQSDQPGFVACQISRDVLSDNGQVVLMERGTQVVGEYRGGLAQGQTRLHVLWSRAKTPTGVVVDLGSAGTDALGRAGFGGDVDTHFWERVSAAMLLSVVSDGSQLATSRLQKSMGVQAQSLGQAPNSAAAVAVEQTSSIKPTLHKNQGEMVSIFVARDLNFSSVYGLRATNGKESWIENRHIGDDAGASPVGGRRFK